MTRTDFANKYTSILQVSSYSEFIGFMYSPDNVAISGPVNCCLKVLK